MAEDEQPLIPLAVLAAPVLAEPTPDLPIAYIPRAPAATTYREMLERAVGWGRR